MIGFFFGNPDRHNGTEWLKELTPGREIDMAFEVGVNEWNGNRDLELKIIDGSFSDQMVINILAGCKALIIAAEEDFGIISLEAQALGKPVIAFKAGGVLETVIEGKTGVLFNNQQTDSLKDAINKLNSIKINPDDCRQNIRRFSKQNFIKNFQTSVASL